MLDGVNKWAYIIRNVFWKDETLKQLMKIPSGTNILQFRDKYFIKASFTNELLTNEDCRIVYAETPGYDTAVPNIRKKTMIFDIYVKDEELYTASNDRLISRTDLIAARINYLLTKDRYVANTGYRFWQAGDSDLGTRTVGYTRKGISFYFMRNY